jgi:hypothetical protein
VQSQKELVAVYQPNPQARQFILVSKHSLEYADFGKPSKAWQVTDLSKKSGQYEAWNLAYSPQHQSLALLIDQEETQSVVIYKAGATAQTF